MMKSLVLVQSNTGHGHISRATALGECLTNNRILTRPFTGKSKSIDFFGKDKNDLYENYKEYNPDVIITETYPFGRYGWDPFWSEHVTTWKHTQTR